MSWLPEHTFRRVCLILIMMGSGMAGCGYSPAGGSLSVLGDGNATLRFTGLDQPTLLPWVSNALRTALREEISARNLAVWADDGSADFSLQVRVEEFTVRNAVKSSADAALLHTGSVTLTAVIYRGMDNAEVWRSKAHYADTFENDTQETMAPLLFRQAVRILTGSLRQSF